MYKAIKRILIMFLPLLLLLVQFQPPINAMAVEEESSTETKGTIGFTGRYEPIGVPDPVPPVSEIAKPVVLLPQTNEVYQTWLIWLGILIISIVSLLWKQKTNKLK